MVSVLVLGRFEYEVERYVVIAIVDWSIVFRRIDTDPEINDSIMFVQVLLASFDQLRPIRVVRFGQRKKDNVGQRLGFVRGVGRGS